MAAIRSARSAAETLVVFEVAHGEDLGDRNSVCSTARLRQAFQQRSGTVICQWLNCEEKRSAGISLTHRLHRGVNGGRVMAVVIKNGDGAVVIAHLHTPTDTFKSGKGSRDAIGATASTRCERGNAKAIRCVVCA